MKVFLGMITSGFDCSCSVVRFLENAEKYGHEISGVVATYSRGADESYVAAVSEKAPLHLIDLNKSAYLAGMFKKLGLSRRAQAALLDLPDSFGSGLVPYGFNRNQVVAEAMLRGADALIFIDSDVFPFALAEENGEVVQKETDFFGSHLKFLKASAQITTSEYSGSNILPPARFDGMDDLLVGLKKENMIPYWRESQKHRCVALMREDARPCPCDKVLGGNAGFLLEVFSVLPPFYSPCYTAPDGFYLARGEDTVLSASMKAAGVNCVDIQTPIFHDTYKNWPHIPDLRTEASAKERFYTACAGWTGRNPFLISCLGEDVDAVTDRMRRHLLIGSRAAAQYTGDRRFLTLPDKLEICADNLDYCLYEFKILTEAWDEFITKSGRATEFTPARVECPAPGREAEKRRQP